MPSRGPARSDEWKREREREREKERERERERERDSVQSASFYNDDDEDIVATPDPVGD